MQSRDMLKSHDESVSLNPNVRYIENKNKEKWSTGTNLWAVRPVRKSVTLNPWGLYAAGRKTTKMSQSGVDYGGPLGEGTIKQEERGSSGNGRWAVLVNRGSKTGRQMFYT